ncbi:MAG TPA: CBS domain-containing protein [Rhodanobacteraceae bacterium]|jgi:CBS domain-containing protein|nr:CBS domain-containing protein [Rhodanobacteraceae bacterium]
MDIRSVMTPHPKCCPRSASLSDVAQLMRDEDVGQIPVVEEADSRKLVGVVTDRDIVVRAVAAGKDPSRATAGDCMTAPAATIAVDASLEECARLMASQQVRRMPVVDEDGMLCGIVAQADVQATDARSLKEEIADRVSIPH